MKRILITGATSGIGLEAAKELAKDHDNQLIIMARNEKKIEDSIEQIKIYSGNEQLESIVCDFSSLSNVKKASEEYLIRFDSLDTLVNNAGFIAKEKKLTIDGIEETIAVNHFAPFLLTNQLLDLLKQATEGRVVNVASRAHRMAGKFELSDLKFEQSKWSAFPVYGISKLFNIWFSNVLAEKLVGTNVTSNSLHPGVIATNFGNSSFFAVKFGMKLISPFIKNSSDGAKTTIYLAQSDEVKGISGSYYSEMKKTQPTKLGRDIDKAHKLWYISEEVTSSI